MRKPNHNHVQAASRRYEVVRAKHHDAFSACLDWALRNGHGLKPMQDLEPLLPANLKARRDRLRAAADKIADDVVAKGYAYRGSFGLLSWHFR